MICVEECGDASIRYHNFSRGSLQEKKNRKKEDVRVKAVCVYAGVEILY